MPASEVMNLYRQKKLHSGPGGPIVKSKAQATAIQISMARKEGHKIPKVKGSFQRGGLVSETGNYLVHKNEVVPLQQPFGARVPQNYSSPDVENRTKENPQAKDIAARTRSAEQSEYRGAMKLRQPPWEMMKNAPPATTDPHYAVEGLKGNVAQRMHEQGVKGSFQQGGTVAETGDYKAHKGEELVPPDIGVGTGPTGMPPALGTTAGPAPPTGRGGSRGPNPMLARMQENVSSPLHRVEGFKRGGMIPRTGIYRLHEGEHVIPANLAKRYREAKAK